MPGETKSHYETLGVRRDATPDEVRRAYFKCVRAHSPENDPAGFQRVSEAYRVLSDPEARKAYDATDRIPAPMAHALAAASNLVATDPGRAGELAKTAVAHRDAPAAAIRYAAEICLRAGRAPLALRLTTRLAQEFPGDPDSELLDGRVLVACGRWGDAIDILTPVVARNPALASATIALATAHRGARHHAESLKVLNRFISNWNGPAVHLIPIHVARFHAAVDGGLGHEVATAIEDIRSSAPADDIDARRWSAELLADVAVELANRGAFGLAATAIRTSLEVFDHEHTRYVAQRIEAARVADAEAGAALDDAELKAWVGWVVGAHTGHVREAEWTAKGWPLVVAACKRPEDADADWEVLRARYPAIAAAAAARWRALREQAVAEAAAIAAATAKADHESKVMGLIILGGIVVLILAVLWQRYTDEAPTYRPPARNVHDHDFFR